MNASDLTLSMTHQTHDKPRIGFMGTGWIGRLRMQALQQYKTAQFAAVYDPVKENTSQAAALAQGTRQVDSLEELLQLDLDGIVIATPSALHAAQCIHALDKGHAVYCQKPLARTLEETQQVIAAAKRANRLLDVDFSYRYLAGINHIKQAARSGELGEIYAVDLVFHNAYGPNTDWFYDVQSAGGGCVMDLGIHLVDLLFWLLGHREIRDLHCQLYRKGQRLAPPYHVVEDYATVEFLLGDTAVRLACSWHSPAGRPAVIEAKLYGTEGGAGITNINGSFFDFVVERYQGIHRYTLAEPPDDWGGRSLCAWSHQLAESKSFDPKINAVIDVATLIDRIYQR